MSGRIILLIAASVVVDVVVMWWIFTKRAMPMLGGMTIMQFQGFSRSAVPVVREYMRSSYSGRAEQLPDILPELLSRLGSEARTRGAELDRSALKLVATRLIVAEKLASESEVRDALRQVA
jgi:hypothetical protein